VNVAMSQQKRAPSAAERRKSLRAIAIGNALEWYDWTIYGTLSAYLAVNFFSSSDPTSALLSTFAIFAGGFVARPLGGLVFGRVGDKYGRRTALVLTMTTLALTSLGIALTPTYEAIGAWASLMLFALRVLQGLAHGGESGVSYTYVAEIAPAERRGLWSSSVYVSVMLGVMAATGLAALLTGTLSTAQMNSWGWRIGFGLGALLGVYALFLRRSAVETDTFRDLRTVEVTSTLPGEVITPRLILRMAILIVSLSAAMNVVYYTWVTFAPATAIAERGMDANDAFRASLLAQVVALGLLPLMGRLSDRIGRRPNMMAFATLVALAVMPLHAMLDDQPWTLFVSQSIGLAVWSIGVSIYPALIAELVPARIRAVGVSVITSLSVAVFGGTAPYLNAWLEANDVGWIFRVYVIVLAGVTAAAAWIIPETRGTDIASSPVPTLRRPLAHRPSPRAEEAGMGSTRRRTPL
jgi:MHS family alpha-ketoglutarate permease-like MFS transporter